MDTNYFEAVVCGPDLAGLIAAVLLSRRGQRVLLCGHDRQPATFDLLDRVLGLDHGDEEQRAFAARADRVDLELSSEQLAPAQKAASF